MTNTADPILDQLFNADSAQETAWIEQTELRAKRIEHSRDATPIPLPSSIESGNNDEQLTQIAERVKLNGYAVYSWHDEPENVTDAVVALLLALGLSKTDSGVIRDAGELSLLHDATGTPKARFPPYQPKAMNWHTDGYYNAPADVVRCFTLHCVEPAAEGGALVLMDDNFAVLALLNEDRSLVALLSHPEAMTLPSNRDNDGHNRPDRAVPMIYQNTDNSIAMRFTTRSQNIHWRCEATQRAAQRAAELINDHTEWHTKLRLEKGQGVVTRNILHTREAFTDAAGQVKRQMLRGRFTQLPIPVQPTTTPSIQGENTNQEQPHVTR